MWEEIRRDPRALLLKLARLTGASASASDAAPGASSDNTHILNVLGKFGLMLLDKKEQLPARLWSLVEQCTNQGRTWDNGMKADIVQLFISSGPSAVAFVQAQFGTPSVSSARRWVKLDCEWHLGLNLDMIEFIRDAFLRAGYSSLACTIATDSTVMQQAEFFDYRDRRFYGSHDGPSPVIDSVEDATDWLAQTKAAGSLASGLQQLMLVPLDTRFKAMPFAAFLNVTNNSTLKVMDQLRLIHAALKPYFPIVIGVGSDGDGFLRSAVESDKSAAAPRRGHLGLNARTFVFKPGMTARESSCCIGADSTSPGVHHPDTNHAEKRAKTSGLNGLRLVGFLGIFQLVATRDAIRDQAGVEANIHARDNECDDRQNMASALRFVNVPLRFFFNHDLAVDYQPLTALSPMDAISASPLVIGPSRAPVDLAESALPSFSPATDFSRFKYTDASFAAPSGEPRVKYPPYWESIGGAIYCSIFTAFFSVFQASAASMHPLERVARVSYSIHMLAYNEWFIECSMRVLSKETHAVTSQLFKDMVIAAHSVVFFIQQMTQLEEVAATVPIDFKALGSDSDENFFIDIRATSRGVGSGIHLGQALQRTARIVKKRCLLNEALCEALRKSDIAAGRDRSAASYVEPHSAVAWFGPVDTPESIDAVNRSLTEVWATGEQTARADCIAFLRGQMNAPVLASTRRFLEMCVSLKSYPMNA